MSRPIWKGHISFGLVSIPVTLHAAEQRNDIQLKLVDGRNHGAIRYERINEVSGKEVPWSEIVKGYEYEDGKFVLLTEEDLKKVSPEKTQSIDIEAFVPAAQISPQYFDKPYFLLPGKGADKPYAMLREALLSSDRLGIARVVIRTRQYLAAISAKDKALVLDLLRFHQELRKPEEEKLPTKDLTKLRVSEKEIELAQQLIESMSEDWEPEKYHDEYREALLEWIEERAAGGGETEVKSKDEDEPETGKVIDMMELLRASMKKGAKKTAKPQPAKTRKKTS